MILVNLFKYYPFLPLFLHHKFNQGFIKLFSNLMKTNKFRTDKRREKQFTPKFHDLFL